MSMNAEDLAEHLNSKIQLATELNWLDYKSELEEILHHPDFPSNFTGWPLSPVEKQIQGDKKT